MNGKNPGKIVGYYFFALAVYHFVDLTIEILRIRQTPVSSSSIATSLIWFLVLISLGRGLLRGENKARVGAISICVLGLIAVIFFLVILAFWEAGLSTIEVLDEYTPVKIYGSVAVNLILDLGALIILLHPKTRRHYRVPRFSTSKLVTVLEADSPGQLMVVQSFLRGEGIPSFAGEIPASGRLAGGGLGSGSREASGPVALQVLAEHYDQAREILQGMEFSGIPESEETATISPGSGGGGGIKTTAASRRGQ